MRLRWRSRDGWGPLWCAQRVRGIAAARLQGIIVSDLMMPEMTGMALHDHPLRVAPDRAQRMVFLTGGAFTTAAREFLEHVANPRIDKPVVSTNLLAVIAELMPPPAT